MENKELGRLVLKHAEAFPETFRMADWAVETSCGTVACLAGWTLLLHGGYTMKSTINSVMGFFNEDGQRVHPGSEARRILGLTDQEYFPGGGVRPLFYTDEEDALARLRVMVEDE